MTESTRKHLTAHHGDPVQFRDLMVQTAPGRFGPLWWGVWQQHIAANLPAAPTVVDLGCGPGGLLGPLRERHPDAHVTGVEVQPLMIEAARVEAARVGAEIVEADLAGKLPFADSSVHAVTAVMVVHELPYPVPLLAEVARILAPGGCLLIFDWASQPLRHYAGEQELTEDLIQHFREHCLWAPDDLAWLCERQGLTVLEVIARRGGDHAMVAAQKPA